MLLPKDFFIQDQPTLRKLGVASGYAKRAVTEENLRSVSWPRLNPRNTRGMSHAHAYFEVPFPAYERQFYL